MRLKPFTGSITEPITTDAAKVFLKVESADEDALVASLVSGVREHIESDIGKFLTSRVGLVGVLDAWPGIKNDEWFDGEREAPISTPSSVLEFPVRPVTAISLVRTLDEGGNPTTYDAANYYLDLAGDVQLLVRKVGTSWPVITRQVGAIEITFTAGYSAAPSDLMAAFRMLLAHWYEHREAVVTGTITASQPLGVERILKRHRRVRL